MSPPRLPVGPEAQAVALEQAGDAVDVELDAVALGERRARALRGLGLAELVEEALEARRGDDLEDPRGLVAGVPERVPLVARLEDEVARLAEDDLVAELRADPPLQ